MMKAFGKIIVTIFSITMLLSTACSLYPQKKIYVFPTSEVTVVGDTIYCSGKPFAKLWTIDGNYDRQERLFSTQAVNGGGLAIHYYTEDKDIWIHPVNGLSVYHDGKEYTRIDDMERVWNARDKSTTIHAGGRRMEKEDLIRSHVFYIKISDDGKYVYYKSDGILWNSSHEYQVEYGISN